MRKSNPGDQLLHPIALVAIMLLLVNDHILKDLYRGSLVTGKLSDVAGLVFFPLFLQGSYELIQQWWTGHFRASKRILLVCAFATALVFGSIQLFDWAGELYRWGLGVLQAPYRARIVPVSLYMDLTDLLTLPALLVAVSIGWKRCDGSGVPGLVRCLKSGSAPKFVSPET